MINNYFMKVKDLYFKNNGNIKEVDSSSKNSELITFLVNSFYSYAERIVNQMIASYKTLGHDRIKNQNYSFKERDKILDPNKDQESLLHYLKASLSSDN